MPYAEIERPLIRLLTLARDFTDAAGGDWRPIDMHRLMRLATGEGELDAALRSEVARGRGRRPARATGGNS